LHTIKPRATTAQRKFKVPSPMVKVFIKPARCVNADEARPSPNIFRLSLGSYHRMNPAAMPSAACGGFRRFWTQKNETFFAARTALTLTGNLHVIDFAPVTTVLERAKKSCLKTYRRFLVLPGLCQNERMNMKNSSMENGERASRLCARLSAIKARSGQYCQTWSRLNKPNQA
jgi:hypothetical protein